MLLKHKSVMTVRHIRSGVYHQVCHVQTRLCTGHRHIVECGVKQSTDIQTRQRLDNVKASMMKTECKVKQDP